MVDSNLFMGQLNFFHGAFFIGTGPCTGLIIEIISVTQNGTKRIDQPKMTSLVNGIYNYQIPLSLKMT